MFLVLLAAILVVVALVLYINFAQEPLDTPINLKELPEIPPDEVHFTDEQIVRFEVQLTDSDPGVRFAAICALNTAAQKDHPGIGPILVKALGNGDPRVRYLAANQLGVIKFAPAAARLTALLDDKDTDVIAGAAQALPKLQDDGLKAIMKALSANSLQNVDRAMIVLKQITGQSFGQGEQGRTEALEFWAQYKKSSQNPQP